MHIPNYYEFQNSVKLLSGENALEHIPHELANLGGIKPIILTDQTVLKLGLIKLVKSAFKSSGQAPGALFADIPADSSVEVVNRIAGLYKKSGSDSIIAVGGGSVLDTAKGVNLLVSTDSTDLLEHMGFERIKAKLKPMIAVPTTAGTGSEATLAAVIADPQRTIKMEFISYALLPQVAVLDPRMTLTLPPAITAATAMDALTHAIEAYTGLQKNPISAAHALGAIALIRSHLFTAITKGKDKQARLALANASYMAGAAFSNSMVGIVHALGHALGAVCHVPHGQAMAILLPHGMEYNYQACKESYGELLWALAQDAVFSQTPAERRGWRAIQVVKELLNQVHDLCGLPLTLSAVGVNKEQFPAIAAKAMNDGAIITNPVPATRESLEKILDQAW